MKSVIVGDDPKFVEAARAAVDRLEDPTPQVPPPLDPSESFLRPSVLAIVDAVDAAQAEREIKRLEQALDRPLVVMVCRFAPETLHAGRDRASLVAYDDDLVRTLEEAVRWTVAGYVVHPRSNAGHANVAAPIDVDEEVRLRMLSPTECKVLMLVAEAKSNKLIGRTLRISDNTVRVHMRSIFIKLGVENRTQAALLATRFRHSDIWQSKVVDMMGVAV